MPLVFVRKGECGMLNKYFKGTGQDMKLRLYTDSTAIAENGTSRTEVNGFNYAAASLAPATWTVTLGPDASTKSHADYGVQTFTFNGAAGNVYGYYVTIDSDWDAGTNVVVFAEHFSGPFNIQNNGDAIKITLKFELD